MAIKIIEQGTLRKEKCIHCGCLFSFEKEDIEIQNVPLNNGTRTVITCPQCKELIILEQTK